MVHEKKLNTYKASLGMCVSHERTIDWDVMTLVHHIEISAPGYVLTQNGPEIIDPSTMELDDEAA